MQIALGCLALVAPLALPILAQPLTSSIKTHLAPMTEAQSAPSIGFIPASAQKLTKPSISSSSKQTSRIQQSRSKPAKYHTKIHAHKFPKSGGKSAALAIGAAQRQAGLDGGYTNITANLARGTQYTVTVTIGSQELNLLLDTGSSDTWTVSSNASCTDFDGDVISQSVCSFGPTYRGGFPNGALPDEHLYVSYGDGEQVKGPLGYVDVSIAGITAENQTVGLADAAYWIGNNMTSGVLGMAYPSLTDAFFGDDESLGNDAGEQLEYSPVFSTMVGQGQVDNFFSIAINRNAGGGVLGLGGVPTQVAGIDYDTTASTKIIVANVVNQPRMASQLSFYSIIPDGFVFGSSTSTNNIPYIVDSGTSLMYFPPDLAASIAGAFTPPAVYDYIYGGYFTSCDAVAPRMAVVVGGTALYLNPIDMIHHDIVDPLSGQCMISIANGGNQGPFILGDAFLQNVLAVFDIDYGMIEFASRRFY